MKDMRSRHLPCLLLLLTSVLSAGEMIPLASRLIPFAFGINGLPPAEQVMRLAALAAQAGLSRPSIARIERGDDVSTATLSKVAVVLGLTIRVES